MTRHVVEIAADGRSLSVTRGFLCIREDGGEIGRVPLDDILALILSAPSAGFSKRVLTALAERGAPVILSGRDYAPVALCLPLIGHGDTTGIQMDQIAASRSHKKRLWQSLVKAKITAQAWSLTNLALKTQETDQRKRVDGMVAHLNAMVPRVRSGDPDNLEAQAAQAYWPVLLGQTFRRNADGGGANIGLNYGYAVLRAAAARAVVASGLNPALGVFHRNRHNPLCLADDLMEPFRPFVDTVVCEWDTAADPDLTPERKKALTAVLDRDLQTSQGITPIRICLIRLAQSLARGFATGTACPELPNMPDPGRLL